MANIPADPTDLAVVQRGGKLFAHFKLPQHTTELEPIRGDLQLDLRAGVTPSPWSIEAWAPGATKVAPVSLKDGVAQYEFASTPWTGKEIAVAARAIGANGKASNWSNAVILPVVSPLTTPTDLTASATEKGVRLTWKGAGSHFRILRRSDAATDYAEIGTSTALEFLDTSAEFGKSYSYLVQSFTDLGEHREAQSDLSAERAISPKDEFPPAAPINLRATASTSTVELSWDANSETDLANYRVYRSVDGGAFQKIAEVSDIPTYSDKTVQPGKTYRYALTAVDKSGNESKRSAVAEAML